MVIRLVWLAILFAAIQPLYAQILVSSQNTLHLSDSTRGATKRKTILDQNDNYNVNLLQEVMKTADLDDVTPGKYYWKESDLKGKSSYKETYGIIYSDYLTANGEIEDYPDDNDDFARPPSGVMLKMKSGDYVWFIDFHAIWGKSASLREDEATEMAEVYKYFKNLEINKIKTTKIVIAGDWNLDADDDGFDALKELDKGILEVTPNMETSLTRSGDPSQPYDHFVAEKGKLTGCVLTPIPDDEDSEWWRDNVSDHRGIKCTYTYK